MIGGVCTAAAAALATPVESPGQAKSRRYSPPTGFDEWENTASVMRHTVHGDKTLADVVWMPFGDVPHVYVLESVDGVRRLLRTLGFDALAVEGFVQQTGLTAQTDYCLALATTPERCAVLRLDDTRAGQIAVHRVAGSERMLERAMGQQWAFVGSTAAFASGATPVGSVPAPLNLSASNTGLLTYNRYRLEYDVSVQQSSATVPGTGSYSSVRYNLLAAGAEWEQGVGYAGLLRAGLGAGGAHVGSAQGFFSRPALGGLAWRSDSAALAAGQARRYVELDLTAPSLVRVHSDGVTLAQGNYPAGRQRISINGFTPAFVDVQVRDERGGGETTRQAQVMTEVGTGAGLRAGSSSWYADLGRVARTNTLQPSGVEWAPLWQGMLFYNRSTASLRFSAGAQTLGMLRRVALGVGGNATQGYTWESSAMLGDDAERGFQAMGGTVWGPVALSAAYTRYEAPLVGGALSPRCTVGVDNYCFSTSTQGFESGSLSLSVPALRTQLSVSESRTGTQRSQNLMLSSSVPLSALHPQAMLMLMAFHGVQTQQTALSAFLALPMDWLGGAGVRSTGTAVASGSGNGGPVSASVGVSSSYSGVDYPHLRSTSLSVSGQQDKGVQSSSVQASAHWGPLDLIGGLSHATNSSTAANVMASATYGVSGGRAFLAQAGQGGVGLGALTRGGIAHMAVVNRSRHAQQVSVGNTVVDVPAKSNTMVPVPAGFLRGVTVAPGPVLNDESLQAGQMLYRGNIQRVDIPDGQWLQARFVQRAEPDDGVTPQAPLPVRFTYKYPGGRMERVYQTNDGASMLFEYDEFEQATQIERFVTVGKSDTPLRCMVEKTALPVSEEDEKSYQTVTYTCESYMSRAMKFASVLRTLPTQDTAGVPPTNITAKAGEGDVQEEAPLRLNASI